MGILKDLYNILMFRNLLVYFDTSHLSPIVIPVTFCKTTFQLIAVTRFEEAIIIEKHQESQVEDHFYIGFI